MNAPGELAALVAREARPLTGAPGDHDELLELVGEANVMLLGEASHGTHEFYRQRAVITKRLIEEKGFSAVAVEADWPDAHRVNRYVKGANEDADSEAALGGFRRFPTWMWRNADVLDFVGWLRAHNEQASEPVGFYGLDLYSLYRSIEAVVSYLEEVDPPAAEEARRRYSCFESFEESQDYGYAVFAGLSSSCRAGVYEQLRQVVERGEGYLRRDGIAAEDEQFHAEENARVVVAAEEYYRSMFSSPDSSWNLRDSHMAGTLERLVTHLGHHGGGKTVVWAHNSHIGDARQTAMSERGEHNLGQLARLRFPGRTALVGFTTYDGTVSAASNWNEPVERKTVRPALAGSVENLFHEARAEAGALDFWLPFTPGTPMSQALAQPMLERAIGVIYRPETERASHYFNARPAAQFDAVLHLDHTRAVEPLEPTGRWQAGEPPETYPTAL